MHVYILLLSSMSKDMLAISQGGLYLKLVSPLITILNTIESHVQHSIHRSLSVLNDRDSDFFHFQVNYDFVKYGSKVWEKVDLGNVNEEAHIIHCHYDRLRIVDPGNISEIFEYQRKPIVQSASESSIHPERSACSLEFMVHFKSAVPHAVSDGMIRYEADSAKIANHMLTKERGEGKKWF